MTTRPTWRTTSGSSHLIGQSFPNTGIEILVHDLVNPSKAIVAIEHGEVTGRTLGHGATKLVLDLKTRRTTIRTS